MPNDTKLVKSPTGRGTIMRKSTMNGIACAGCGEPLKAGLHYIAVCPDCGGIFCESCVADGTFESHECEPDEFD